MTTAHPAHYLPAVNPPFAPRPPFVTSTGSDSNIVFVQPAHIMHPTPNVNSRPGSRRGPGQSYPNYRSANSFPHGDAVRIFLVYFGINYYIFFYQDNSAVVLAYFSFQNTPSL